MQKYLLNGFEVFKVLPISHEILRKKTYELYNFTNKEEDTLSMMIDTLRLYKNDLIDALALAAPQIGWEKRLFICADLQLQTRKKTKYTQKVNVYLNPEIIQKSNDLILSKENCLSLPPNKTACVMRSNKIAMKYYNLLGIEMVVEAEGIQACIYSILAKQISLGIYIIQKNQYIIQIKQLYQHEIDHLNGVNVLEIATSIIDTQQC